MADDKAGDNANDNANDNAGENKNTSEKDSGHQKPSPDMQDNQVKPYVDGEPLTLWQTTQSVLYAMLGVQKSKNARRDFSKGKASHFIIIGVAFGILFVLVVASFVNLILSFATS